ncbi:hypothetical protein BSL78_14310 [Apostichopus japonicus]|uniref:Uncharacterized protein n=1 Tax=Stichopus japonicus TaxID=307972 RepID=A0A2G8KLC0_STIJA|nr:hypothetical protein BSL78_14310 [Apostichopus japonicus]
MFFGTKSGHKNKTSMEAVEEEHDINKSRDGTKTDEELNESMGERKGRKVRFAFHSVLIPTLFNSDGRGKMHGLLNSFRKTREDVKVKRRVPLQRDDSDADLDDSNLEASGQWATRKGTPGTPDKAEDIVPYGSIGKQRGLFVQGAGTQVMLASITAPSHHAMLEESAKKVLNPDESKAVLRHIKRYDEEGNIDALVVPLLAILDQPEKVLLLRDIRGFIAPKDIGRFDSLVSKKELEAMKLVRKQEKEKIIPRQDSYADASSPELSPGEKSNRNFTFGESEAAVLASLNSALGPGDPSRDLNANSVVNHNSPHSASLEERDFRGGFTSVRQTSRAPYRLLRPVRIILPKQTISREIRTAVRPL